jgi:hypothetical protein
VIDLESVRGGNWFNHRGRDMASTDV